jgi:GNAT superfamily N-acetyltransferase
MVLATMRGVDAEAVEVAAHDDVEAVAALAEVRRQNYEAHQPLFWRQADDALTRHTGYLHGLVDDPQCIFLVARHSGALSGFVIGRLVPAPPVYEPGGLTCLVDDFAVARDDDWSGLGVRLLKDLAGRAHERGAVQAVVVSGRHDEAKRQALTAAGLSVATEWWVGPLDRL